MNIEQFRQLIAIEGHGTLTEAAKAVPISQSALTRSMQRLESELGIAIFERNSQRLKLNQAGKITLRYAHDICNAADSLKAFLDSYKVDKSSLSVATVAPAPLWKLTGRVVELLSGVFVSSHTLDNSESIERLVINGEVDFGITTYQSLLANVRSTPLMTEHLLALIPESDSLAARGSVGWEELDGHVFLLRSNIGFWRNMVANAMPKSHLETIEDAEVFRQMTLSTEHFCFTSDAPQNWDRTRGRVAVPISEPLATTTFYLIALKDMNAKQRVVFNSFAK